MKTHFPTRQTVSEAFGRNVREHLRPASMAEDASFANPSPSVEGMTVAPALSRFVMGIDVNADIMPLAEVEALGDAFTQSILLKGKNPKTLRELLDAVAKLPPGQDFPLRQAFLIAEGAQPRRQNPDFELNARLVFTWRRNDLSKVDMMLSTVPLMDDPQALLQLISWSPKDGSFHYFERERISREWVWAGNSFHALDPRSRGKGPFDSHINGSLVMKELKLPWSHWHSNLSSIPREVLPPESELLTEPQFQDIQSANDLEAIVRAGIRRWTNSRFEHRTANSVLSNFTEFLRQVLWCTSINLTSSPSLIGTPDMGVYALPSSFFFDFDAIDNLSDTLGSEQLLPIGRFQVSDSHYDLALDALNVAISDVSPSPPRTLRGDTHFAFLVPERAAEDQEVLKQLVDREAVSARTALSLLFVDFSNPIFSPERAKLLQYAPTQVRLGALGSDFDGQFISAIRSASPPAGSPEARFLELVDDPNLLVHVRQQLANYKDRLQDILASQAGVKNILELACSRRQAFADKRKLREFNSTLALTGLARPHLAMRPDGSIFSKGIDIGEDEL